MGLNWVLLLAHVVLFHITIGSEVVVQVNTKKWIYYVPERFLSLTVDPLTLAAASPLTQESFNMAKGLSPSFVRLGGIGTNAVYFGKIFMENSTTVSESQWDSVNEFAKNTGLDIIASLNPTARSDGVWDSQNSLELISYSAKKRFGVAWQLGYDMRGYNASGAGVGKDLVKLRKMLDGVPNYANSPVFGPDVTSVNGAKQIHFIKDLIVNAGSPLACLILRPDFKSDATPEDPYDLMSSMMNELDTYVWNKDVRRSIPKKPVWIAEPVVSQGSFEEAIKFVKRIGHAARLGVQIYLRQAGTPTLKTPTPDYWFSLLYKTLVGQGVLDYKILARNQTGLHVFTHCTVAVPQDKSVLDTDWNYEKGAVTLFGVNESPEPTKLVLKVTNKEEPIHIYTLTTAKKNGINADNIVATFLNGQELKLSPAGELPVLSPKVKKPSKSSSVTIPGDSIYFVVMPDSRVRTCSIVPLSTPDLNLSELTKRLRFMPQGKSDTSQEDLEEEVQSTEGVYVSFTKKRSVKPSKDSETPLKGDILGKTLMRTLISKLAPKKIDVKTEVDQEEIPVKYITFNENSFLNKLAEGIKGDIEGDPKQPDDDKPENKKSRVEYKYPALASAIKTSNMDKHTGTSVIKTPKSDVISSSVDDNEKIQVISIKPMNSADINDEILSRSRRSSKEEPSVKSSDDSKSMEFIKSMMEAKKIGTPLSEEMSDVDKDLSHHNITFKLSPDDPEEISRSARQALDHIATKSKLDELKTRNTRHAGDASEEQESDQKADIVKTYDTSGKNIETETLAKIVEKTEQISEVSESPQGVLIPEEVPQEKLEDLMLKTAKSNSEPEPDGTLSKDELFKDPPQKEESASLMKQQTDRPESVPMPLLHVQQPGTPLIGQLGGQNSPLPGQFNPMLVPSSTNPGTMVTKENDQIMPLIQKSDPPSPNTETNDVPVLISPMPSAIPAPYYNEQKENAINKILNKIVKEEDSVLAKIPTGSLKEGMVEELKPSGVVPIDVEGHTVLIAPEDLTALKQPDAEGRNSGLKEKSALPEPETGTGTLVDSSQQLDLSSEVSQDTPSVKVPRQVKIELPTIASATPKAATATLAAPVNEPSPTTPGTVSPTGSKPPSANQLPPLKAPTPEELRERYKVLREKMIELRQQYLEAREKRLEEFRKQVVVARTTPDPEGTIKTIKRREAELKEWFKKFDKREVDPATLIHKPEIAKSRPRRLSMFTNDENLDMEKFFEDDTVESYNYKRSPEIPPPQQQFLPQTEAPQKAENFGKLLIPLDSRSPQGIVYNNRIYPARLFGYIDPQNSYSELRGSTFDVPLEVGKYGEYKARETADISEPISRERLTYVPKDAFIKEFKSDFVPVVLLDPAENRKTARSKRSILTQSNRSHRRVRRSTLTDLEEQFHRVKEEIFPKISSWIKNLSDHPPWKRDLQRSSRTRRNVQDFLLTNDLRSMKYPTKALTKSHSSSTPEIEDFISQNIDKGEDSVFKVAKKYTGLAEKIDKALLSNDPEESIENGYCEEIGTSGKSVIRDPFAKKSEKSDQESDQDSSSKMKDVKSNEPHDLEHSKSLQDGPKLIKAQASQPKSNIDENSEPLEDVMFATVVADKIRDFFANLQTFFGVSDR